MNLRAQLDASAIGSMAGLDVPWMLEQWAARSPDKPCLVWEPFSGPAQSFSYGELAEQSRQAAAGLSHHGIRAGDFVILHLENSPEFVIAWYACAMLGAVAVSTNTRSVARDLSYFAEHTGACCVITQPAFARLIEDACPAVRLRWVTDNNAGEVAAIPDGVRARPYAELFEPAAAPPPLSRDPMRPLSIQFTSGTTSRPKAVLWTHANALWAGKVSAAHMRLRREDVTLAFLPMFHTNAQAYSMLATHWSGGTLVLQPKFSASRFWEVSNRHRVTWCSTIPFAFKALAGREVPPHHYRFWGTGLYLQELGRQFGVDFIGWWGMTETLTHGIVTDVDHPGPEGTIGRCAPEYEIQLRKPGGELAGRGEKGALFIRGVRGVTLFLEYYGDPEATARSFDADGWFDTGDVVRMDEQGWLFFSDREKDMLRVGAENVAASEIESVILQTGFVQECAVVGRSHPMLEEVPVVFVIPAAGAPEALQDAIIEHCRRNLADFKVVREVHVVDDLPRSTLEKVAKQALRERLVRMPPGTGS
ncbi:MAG: AMP-binding protein [Pseudomonadales bacterium]